jgi:MFS family permease
MKRSLQVSSLWAYRDMRLVLPGRAVSMAGDAIAMLALSLRVSEQGGPASMTMLWLAFSVPLVLMIPVAGRIVDGVDSRTVLVLSSLLQGAAGVGLALSHGLPATLALVCVMQACQAVNGPAWGGLVPRIVGEELTGRAVGLQQALTGIAMLAGSGAGGMLVGWWGIRTALLADAGTFVVLALAGAAVRTRRRPEPAAVRRTAGRGGALAGLRVIAADRLLKVLVPGLWIFILAAEATNVIEVFLVTDEIGLGATGLGAVFAVQGAGGIFGAYAAGRLADDRRVHAVVAGTLGVGLGGALMGLAPSAALLVAGCLVSGLAGGLINAGTGALVVTRAQEAVRGRVLSALNGSCRAFSVLALLLGGVAGATAGTRTTYVGCGLLCVLTGLLLAAGLRRGRRQALSSANDSAPDAVCH